MKKLILAAALLVPLSGVALAQEAGTGFVGTPERAVTNQAPRAFSAPREFTARRLVETRQQHQAHDAGHFQAPAQADRNAVPSSGGGVY